jgi:hypothetical protein
LFIAIKLAMSGTNNKTGPTKLPPALNPESPAIVQPYKEFLAMGWISKLQVEYLPMGYKVSCRVSAEISAELASTDVAPLQAKELIIKSGKWSPRAGKSKTADGGQPRPKKSLVEDDFKDGTEKLRTRALAVAEALGSTVAMGRIGSLKLMIKGADTFKKWWDEAEPSEISRLFADAKRWEKFTDENHKALSEALGDNCPFRGSVPTPEAEAEDKPKESGKKTPPPKGASPKSGPSGSK